MIFYLEFLKFLFGLPWSLIWKFSASEAAVDEYYRCSSAKSLAF